MANKTNTMFYLFLHIARALEQKCDIPFEQTVAAKSIHETIIRLTYHPCCVTSMNNCPFERIIRPEPQKYGYSSALL